MTHADWSYNVVLVRFDGQVEETQIQGFGAEAFADGIVSRAKKEKTSLNDQTRYTYGCVFVIDPLGQLDHKRGEFCNEPTALNNPFGAIPRPI